MKQILENSPILSIDAITNVLDYKMKGHIFVINVGKKYTNCFLDRIITQLHKIYSSIRFEAGLDDYVGDFEWSIASDEGIEFYSLGDGSFNGQ